MDSARKMATLNPNAAEFVPFSLRSSSSGSPRIIDGATSLNVSGALGKSVLERSESSISNHSDEESHQYWCSQLPDDITPDFKVTEEDNSQNSINSIPFSTLSLRNGSQNHRVSSSTGSDFLLKQRLDLSPHGSNGISFSDKMRHSFPSYSEDAISGSFFNATAKPWDKPMLNNDQFMSLIRDGSSYNGNSTQTMLNEQPLSENTEMNPLEFLASQFPGFASESLTEVFFTNGGDLNLTIEMLTQLELQVDSGLNQNLNSKGLSAPNLTAMDFPALPMQDNLNSLSKYGLDNTIQQGASSHHSSNKDNLLMFKSSSSFPTRGATDFATALKKMPSSDGGGIWQYDRKGSSDASVGSSRSSHVLASSYNGGQGRGGIYTDRLQSRGSSRAAPWLETGEAVANMYSDVREEARDYARVRNVYLEQAHQAYLIGNKALAKELSVKGQLHNIHMKAAHGKAQESIYRQRNPVGSEMLGNNSRGQERIIDLHGLHVNEAIHVLKRELVVTRSVARSAGQRLKVYICVGTGHHTRGARTPARLPVSIQRYLLEEEGLDYVEPQPGLLQVMVY